MAVGALTAVLTVCYVADLVVSAGEVPRGVTVAGVDIGGLDRDEAEETLRAELGPLTTRPVVLRAGGVEAELDPAAAGLSVDWAETVDRVGGQPWNPVDRVVSVFRHREVGLATEVDPKALRTALRRVATRQIDREPSGGRIGVRVLDSGRVRPYAVDPSPGLRVSDPVAAAGVVRQRWPSRRPIDIPVETTAPPVRSEAVHAALRDEVAPLVSGPVRLLGDGADAVVSPVDIGRALRVDTEAEGGPSVSLDRDALRPVVAAELERTEQNPHDARLTFADGAPVVEPSVRGTRIDWDRTLDRFVEAASTRDSRDLMVAYDAVEPAVTTAEVETLGVSEVVGRFVTEGFADEVRPNLDALARAVDGVLVRPGETFSLERHTGPRTASRGYVVAPLREDGTGPEVIGGGVSQLTSTFYNAVYLAGFDRIERTPQPTHLARYPEGRDAVSLAGDGSTRDFSFTNDGSTAVAIRATVSDAEVAVTLWGTRRYEVDTVTGPRRDLVPPPVIRGAGPDCAPERGEPGFTVSTTRVRRDADTGAELDRRTHRVRYAPRPTVVC